MRSGLVVDTTKLVGKINNILNKENHFSRCYLKSIIDMFQPPNNAIVEKKDL